MATAGDLITAAANKVGIYTLTTAQTTTCLNSLNSLERVLPAEELLFAVEGETLSVSASDPEYTWGSGGDLSSTRPARLDKVYIQNSEGYDFPQEIISVTDYNDIFLKTIVARPDKVYFLPEYPLAKLIFETYPDASYTAYIDSWKLIDVFDATTTTMLYPPEYEEFFIYNLAVRIGEDWDRVVKKSVMDRADETKRIISSIKAKSRPPARAKVDPFLKKSYYNINYDF